MELNALQVKQISGGFCEPIIEVVSTYEGYESSGCNFINHLFFYSIYKRTWTLYA